MLVDAGQQPQIVAGGVVWGVAGWLPWPRSMVWTAPRDLLTAAATSEEIEAGMAATSVQFVASGYRVCLHLVD
ncbi:MULTISPECIES: hypothetical protein [unclassified Streptomyces]|uniref:hypothetical protein n=1 Tax=unclassified Streptomyces TaxID=2593676 RepID=UPI0033C7C631